MQKIIFSVIFIFSAQVLSSEQFKIYSEIKTLTEYSCPDQKMPSADDQNVYIAYLKGNAIDESINPEVSDEFLKITAKVLKDKNKNVITMNERFTNWENICRQFKKTNGAKILIFGHGEGASAANDVAKCLSDLKIETALLVNIGSEPIKADKEENKISHLVMDRVNVSAPNVAALSLLAVAKVLGMEAALNYDQSVSQDDIKNNLSAMWKCDSEKTAKEVAVGDRSPASISKP